MKFVAKKLGLTVDELTRYIDAPAVDHLAYPNGMRLHGAISTLKHALRRLSGAPAAA